MTVDIIIDQTKLKSMSSDFLNTIPELRNSDKKSEYIDNLVDFINQVMLSITANYTDISYDPNTVSTINARRIPGIIRQ